MKRASNALINYLEVKSLKIIATIKSGVSTTDSIVV